MKTILRQIHGEQSFCVPETEVFSQRFEDENVLEKHTNLFDRDLVVDKKKFFVFAFNFH